MIYTNPADAAPAIAEQIARADTILLLTHVNPDGDALGSLLGMWHGLTALGKRAIPLASSALPSYCMWLPGIDRVAVFERGASLPPSDLVIMVDTASLARVGRVHEEHGAELAQRPLVIIDHHVTNVGEGLVNLIVPTSASCAELVYRLLRAMGAPVTPDAATCMLLGLTTDTQSFQTSSSGADSLRAAADLIEAGADQRAVVRNVYFSMPYSTLQLTGMALGQLRREGDMLWTRVTQEMLRATGAEDEAGDDVMRQVQRTEGGRVFALFKERHDGTVKISLRSVPGINVALIAATWGGGGHAQAAGANLEMPLDQAEAEVLAALRHVLSSED
jgi:bifunctional oligoribonuclease and PAP phosphatase NrnA